jgi:hypothetical protein
MKARNDEKEQSSLSQMHCMLNDRRKSTFFRLSQNSREPVAENTMSSRVTIELLTFSIVTLSCYKLVVAEMVLGSIFLSRLSA